jgi:hypothetical protein
MVMALHAPAGYAICGRVAGEHQGGLQMEAVMAPPPLQGKTCKGGRPTLVHQKRGRPHILYPSAKLSRDENAVCITYPAI